jgi:hypothetical protein
VAETTEATDLAGDKKLSVMYCGHIQTSKHRVDDIFEFGELPDGRTLRIMVCQRCADHVRMDALRDIGEILSPKIRIGHA